MSTSCLMWMVETTLFRARSAIAVDALHSSTSTSLSTMSRSTGLFSRITPLSTSMARASARVDIPDPPFGMNTHALRIAA